MNAPGSLHRRIDPTLDLSHLLEEPNSVCWWCQERPADSGEHKVKKADLSRMMGDGDELLWVNDQGQTKSIRGKRGITRDRHGVVKFEKLMCSRCNNAESQPFDRAYDKFASFIHGKSLGSSLSFEEIFGASWARDTADLGRYFVKHFGCRMARSRLPIPSSLREFLNGSNDMVDAQMCLIEDKSIPYAIGEYSGISDDIVFASSDGSYIDRYVFVYYFGRYGVRFEWLRDGIPNDRRDQFFHYPGTLIPLFPDWEAVVYGEPKKRGPLTRFLQWAAN